MGEVDQCMQRVGPISLVRASFLPKVILYVRDVGMGFTMHCQGMGPWGIMREFVQFAERCQRGHQRHSQRKHAQHEHAQGMQSKRKAAGTLHGRRG